jgi:hypothetical protein
MTRTQSTTDVEMSKEVKDAIIDTFENIESLSWNYHNQYPITVLSGESRTDEDYPPTNETITETEATYNRFEALVDLRGELKLDDILDEQEQLLFMKDGIEISLLGTKSYKLERYIWIEVKVIQTET